MTLDIVTPVLQWLNTHAEYSWAITFIISASESIAVIGTIIPGSITMTAIGALAGAGIIPLWSTLLWAFLGAVVGDSISYALGHYFKHRLPQIWPFRKNLTLLKQGEKFFRHYGGMGVFIGRFVGPIRALIPVVAGMMGMKPLHFLVANIASAAGWAPAYMLPGILLGAASLELPPDIATRVILILIFWLLFILLCLWLIRKIPLFIHHQIIRFFSRLWHKLQKSPHLHMLKTLLQHHDVRKTPQQLTLIFYLFLLCGVFVALASYVFIQTSPDIFINNSIYHFFRGIYTPGGRDLMVYLTLFGQKQVITPVIFIVISWMLISKRWYLALHALGLLVLAGVSIFVIKYCVHSPRPWGVYAMPPSFSFPSGHTTLASIFYGGLLLLINHSLTGKIRKLAFILISLIILSVSISRLYLGVHWFTDILGAWLLSAALLVFTTISFNHKQEAAINIRRLLTITALSFSIIYIVYAHYAVPQLEDKYTQLELPIQETTLDNWWNKQKDTFLPEWRVSLFGFPSQAINIEWIGELSAIKKTLFRSGWEAPPKREWTDILFRLSGIQSAEHLPIISPLYLDKKPSLVLIKNIPEGKKLLVLRFWQSNTILKETQKPLWVGVVGLVPRTYGWLSRRYKMDIYPDPHLLFKKTPANVKLKNVNIALPQKNKKSTQPVMLIR